MACGYGSAGCDGYHCCVASVPPPPPSWPPHQLFVDPGEHVWPSAWFGNLSTVSISDVTPEPWVTSGVTDGYDFGLPPFTQPSLRGLLVLKRSFYGLPDPPASNLPTLQFAANPVYTMWISWQNLEPTSGNYRLDALMANYHHAVASGWRFGLRLLTSRVAEAPTYLSSLNCSTIDDGLNYDPACPLFHARYLALLDALKTRGLCQQPGFVMAYVGYASTSWGDEYIGPHGPEDAGDPAINFPHVKARLDGWASVCENATTKVMMGGESAYGRSLGFGTRNGFVEHYWYQVPDADYGQQHSHGDDTDPYLYVNESAPLLAGELMLGDENEEYEHAWSSDWQTHEPGELGGEYNASAPPQGHHARYGPLASFPFRYLMSSLRALQMRVTYLLASSVVVNPSLYSYVALELGREAEDSPDAWCFMASAQFKWGRGTVSNFERWLYQRDQPPTVPDGVITFPDAKLTQTPAWPANHTWMTSVKHDWIAHAAPRGVIGFALDPRFAHSAAGPLIGAVVKVSYFDIAVGNISLTQAHLLLAPNSSSAAAASSATGPMLPATHPQPTVGDGALRTISFHTPLLLTRSAAALAAAYPYDFEVRAVDQSGASQPLVLSFVRVIKDFEPPPPAPPSPLAPMLQNAGADCWVACGLAQGACPGYCGTTGACCRSGFSGAPSECGLGSIGCVAIMPTPRSGVPSHSGAANGGAEHDDRGRTGHARIRKTTVYVSAAGVRESVLSPSSFQPPGTARGTPSSSSSARAKRRGMSVLRKMAMLSGLGGTHGGAEEHGEAPPRADHQSCSYTAASSPQMVYETERL